MPRPPDASGFSTSFFFFERENIQCSKNKQKKDFFWQRAHVQADMEASKKQRRSSRQLSYEAPFIFYGLTSNSFRFFFHFFFWKKNKNLLQSNTENTNGAAKNTSNKRKF